MVGLATVRSEGSALRKLGMDRWTRRPGVEMRIELSGSF